jgi:hypothetical protein
MQHQIANPDAIQRAQDNRLDWQHPIGDKAQFLSVVGGQHSPVPAGCSVILPREPLLKECDAVQGQKAPLLRELDVVSMSLPRGVRLGPPSRLLAPHPRS